MIANYTKLFSEFLTDNPTFLTDLVDLPSPFKEELIKRLTNRWDYYEIAGYDSEAVLPNTPYDDFKRYFTDVYKLNSSYYKELLTNYTKEYDYATGNKKTTTDTNHVIGSGSTTGSGTSTKYTLPNKVATNEYPSSKDTSVDSGTSNTDNTNEGSSEVTYHDEFLELKKQYMAQVRDLYIEFANRFNDCFLHLF